jgi:glutaminase
MTTTLPLAALLAELHAEFRAQADGRLADYIPELAKADPSQFGIAVATCDGFVYETGDTRAPFTIQSISKPIVYGLALEDRGRDDVLARIGVEPSGDPFNSITFDEGHNRPFNPMVNAGAIAATALVAGDSPAARMERILEKFARFAGHPVAIDEDVYRSEDATGHRNRAIAYLELNSGMIDGDVRDHLDLYFRQCSILVSAADLAVMAATLANNGMNPVTGERALERDCVRDVLSVMNTCGMYNYAGEWQFRVGLPAKSGVGGGIMAVLPGQLGLGVFSPLLDEVGNSSRGIEVCKYLSQRLRLHLLDHRGVRKTAIRRHYRVSDIRSKRIRPQRDRERLDELGGLILVFEMQGDLYFSDIELVTRRVMDERDSATYFVLDGTRLQWIDEIAFDLIRRLGEALAAAHKRLFIVLPPARAVTAAAPVQPYLVPDLDSALARCEDLVLRRTEAGASAATPLEIGAVDIFRDFPAAELAILARETKARRFAAGESIVSEGEGADSLFLLTQGSVDVCVSTGETAARHRLAVIDAGNVFGELALFGLARSADVVAQGDVEVQVLSKRSLAVLKESHPAIYARLLESVGRSLALRLQHANNEIRALA